MNITAPNFTTKNSISYDLKKKKIKKQELRKKPVVAAILPHNPAKKKMYMRNRSAPKRERLPIFTPRSTKGILKVEEVRGSMITPNSKKHQLSKTKYSDTPKFLDKGNKQYSLGSHRSNTSIIKSEVAR